MSTTTSVGKFFTGGFYEVINNNVTETVVSPIEKIYVKKDNLSSYFVMYHEEKYQADYEHTVKYCVQGDGTNGTFLEGVSPDFLYVQDKNNANQLFVYCPRNDMKQVLYTVNGTNLESYCVLANDSQPRRVYGFNQSTVQFEPVKPTKKLKRFGNTITANVISVDNNGSIIEFKYPYVHSYFKDLTSILLGSYISFKNKQTNGYFSQNGYSVHKLLGFAKSLDSNSQMIGLQVTAVDLASNSNVVYPEDYLQAGCVNVPAGQYEITVWKDNANTTSMNQQALQTCASFFYETDSQGFNTYYRTDRTMVHITENYIRHSSLNKMTSVEDVYKYFESITNNVKTVSITTEKIGFGNIFYQDYPNAELILPNDFLNRLYMNYVVPLPDKPVLLQSPTTNNTKLTKVQYIQYPENYIYISDPATGVISNLVSQNDINYGMYVEEISMWGMTVHREVMPFISTHPDGWLILDLPANQSLKYIRNGSFVEHLSYKNTSSESFYTDFASASGIYFVYPDGRMRYVKSLEAYQNGEILFDSNGLARLATSSASADPLYNNSFQAFYYEFDYYENLKKRTPLPLPDDYYQKYTVDNENYYLRLPTVPKKNLMRSEKVMNVPTPSVSGNVLTFSNNTIVQKLVNAQYVRIQSNNVGLLTSASGSDLAFVDSRLTFGSQTVLYWTDTFEPVILSDAGGYTFTVYYSYDKNNGVYKFDTINKWQSRFSQVVDETLAIIFKNSGNNVMTVHPSPTSNDAFVVSFGDKLTEYLIGKDKALFIAQIKGTNEKLVFRTSEFTYLLNNIPSDLEYLMYSNDDENFDKLNEGLENFFGAPKQPVSSKALDNIKTLCPYLELNLQDNFKRSLDYKNTFFYCGEPIYREPEVPTLVIRTAEQRNEAVYYKAFYLRNEFAEKKECAIVYMGYANQMVDLNSSPPIASSQFTSCVTRTALTFNNASSSTLLTQQEVNNVDEAVLRTKFGKLIETYWNINGNQFSLDLTDPSLVCTDEYSRLFAGKYNGSTQICNTIFYKKFNTGGKLYFYNLLASVYSSNAFIIIDSATEPVIQGMEYCFTINQSPDVVTDDFCQQLNNTLSAISARIQTQLTNPDLLENLGRLSRLLVNSTPDLGRISQEILTNKKLTADLSTATSTMNASIKEAESKLNTDLTTSTNTLSTLMSSKKNQLNSDLTALYNSYVSKMNNTSTDFTNILSNNPDSLMNVTTSHLTSLKDNVVKQTNTTESQLTKSLNDLQNNVNSASNNTAQGIQNTLNSSGGIIQSAIKNINDQIQRIKLTTPSGNATIGTRGGVDASMRGSEESDNVASLVGTSSEMGPMTNSVRAYNTDGKFLYKGADEDRTVVDDVTSSNDTMLLVFVLLVIVAVVAYLRHTNRI